MITVTYMYNFHYCPVLTVSHNTLVSLQITLLSPTPGLRIGMASLVYVYNGTDGGRHVFEKPQSVEKLLLENDEIVQFDEKPQDVLEWVPEPLFVRETYQLMPLGQGKYEVMKA